MNYNMLDVSSNNHPDGVGIDWGKVAHAGYRYVMIKATEGNDYINPWLRPDSMAAEIVKLHIGYYHFARPLLDQGNNQGDYFTRAITGRPRDLGLALDMESTGGLQWSDLKAFETDFWRAIPDSVKARSTYCTPDWATNLGLFVPHTNWWAASWDKRPREAMWAWQAGQIEVPGIQGLTDVGFYYG